MSCAPPLHGIIGLARTLELSVPRAAKHTVKLIGRSGDHLLGLINNVLDYSRFEAQGVELRPQDVDLMKVAQDVLALCRPLALERGVAVFLDCGQSISMPVSIDLLRVRQILLNVLGNAVKFTDGGGKVLLAIKLDDTLSRIEIAVTDTGIGMTVEAMTRLFEPFAQLDTTTTRRHGGTGLGLSITRTICRTMGGDISCTSKVGKGSRFKVTLPLRRASAVAEESPKYGKLDSLPAPDRFGEAVSVLLAEDNEVNSLVGEYSLKRLGVTVVHASNGAQAVQLMCTNGARADLVLMDCQMPVIDGFEAARLIRSYEKNNGLPECPIVALTASVFESDREACRAAGFFYFAILFRSLPNSYKKKIVQPMVDW